MSKKEEKDELEDVETVSDAQAEKEMHEAAQNTRKKGSRPAAKTEEQDEEEEVTPATRKQAQEELLAAVQRVKAEGKKKSAGHKDK